MPVSRYRADRERPRADDDDPGRNTPCSRVLHDHRRVRITFLWADPRACFTADAIQLVGGRHDLLLKFVVIVEIRSQRNQYAFGRDARELQHIASANLEAASAANACFLVDLLDELRRPAAPVGLFDRDCAHGSARAPGSVRAARRARASLSLS